MRKIETIWHYVLDCALTEGRYKHTQQEIAEKFHFSLSTVHHALKAPSELGAIRKESKFFVLHDARKLLMFWASVRSLPRDVLIAAHVDLPVREIEGQALPSSVYAAYSAAKQILGEPPADYDKVYLYLSAGDLPRLLKRFPHHPKSPPNLIALKMPAGMARDGAHATVIHTYIDIWNLPDWYSRDFIQALEAKIRVLLP